MYCPNCGTQNDDSNQYCTNCNEQLKASQGNQQQQHHTYMPPPSPVYAQPTEEPVSVGFWIGIFCINLIPCVGSLVYIIMMFVWAFGDTKKKSLRNFARAQLILMAIVLVLAIVISVMVAVLGISMFNFGYNGLSW